MTGIIPELQKMFEEVTADYEPECNITDEEYLLINLKYPAMQNEIFRMWMAASGYWPNQLRKDPSHHVREQLQEFEQTETYIRTMHYSLPKIGYDDTDKT